MKADVKIFIAFLLNLAFSVFEFIGGAVTGSVAILSDAVHDLGDTASIAISFFLERKSKKQPDEVYTYGYGRFSVLGGFLTAMILLLGSAIMIGNAIARLKDPRQIDYTGMLLFAAVGLCVNFCGVIFTHGGDSLNQKAVNLHMLEDVLGWAVVLVGAIVMRFTDFWLMDPILSIGVSLFILIHAIGHLKTVAELFLMKAPRDTEEIKASVAAVPGVLEVHHIHLWSMDGQNHYATMHVVTDREPHRIKAAIREALRHHGIGHVTLELETGSEHCHDRTCHTAMLSHHGHHCH